MHSTALVSAHHDSVGVHDSDEAVSDGEDSAVSEPLSQSLLDDCISPGEGCTCADFCMYPSTQTHMSSAIANFQGPRSHWKQL